MRGDVPAADRRDAEDEAHGGRRGDDEPRPVQQPAGAGFGGEPEQQPQGGADDDQPGARDDPAGAAVPRPAAAAQPRHELQRPDEREDGGRDDVDDDGCGRDGEPLVGGDHLRATRELHQPQRARGDRDRRQQQQEGRRRPGHHRGHRTGSCIATGRSPVMLVVPVLVVLLVVVAVVHSDQPSATMAIPLGTASNR